jgi:arylformamidase
MAAIYRAYDKAALDAQYNLRAAVPGAVAHLAECARRSAELRALKPVRLNVGYGTGPYETLNLFPPAKRGAPVLVFVHGGYWQRLDKMDFDYVGAPFLDAGAAFVNVNYGLAPGVGVGAMARQVQAALAWTWRNAPAFGGDRRRIHLAGHSAGGHLTALAWSADWPNEVAPGLPPDLVKSAAAISGLYDLEPIALCYLNDALGLTPGDVAALSPIRRARPGSGAGSGALSLWVGAGETAEFLRQQRDYAAALAKAGVTVAAEEVRGRHHFDIVHDLADPAAALHGWVRGRMGLG